MRRGVGRALDIQIAAIAMTYGATALDTDNVKDFRTLILEDNFEVMELPELS